MKNKISSVKVFAPASVSNLGAGFDIFGMAIEGPGDIVELKRNNNKGIRIPIITGEKGVLSNDPEQNTAGVALKAFLHAINEPINFDIILRKRMPLGSGMGSSAASAVASVFAANEILNRPMKKIDLVQYAMQGEKIASGTIHADNIAPSMLGGFTLIRSMSPFEVLTLPAPKKLCVVMIHPHIEIKTSESRKLVLQKIPLKTAISHWANTASLVKGLYESDLNLIGRSMMDFVAEPGRKKLIPLFELTKMISYNLGAAGFSISGAGPSMVALCANPIIGLSIQNAIKKLFNANGIGCDVMVTKVDTKGARVIR